WHGALDRRGTCTAERTAYAVVADIMSRVRASRAIRKTNDGPESVDVAHDTHCTSAPRETKLSTKFGSALRLVSASKMVDSPSIEEATISSAMATRMMYGLVTVAGASSAPPKVISRWGSHNRVCAPNSDSSVCQVSPPS